MAKAAPNPPASRARAAAHLDAADAMYDRMVRLQAYAQAHWPVLAGVLAAIVIGASAFIAVREYGAGQQVAAAEAHFAATQVEDASQRLDALREVAHTYGATGAGLRAAFAAAQLAFDAEKYGEARALYTHILETQPASPLLPAAALGVGTTLEAEGQPAEAATAYQQALNLAPDGYTAPQAQLALARLAETRGEVDAALALYRDIVSTQPGSLWERDATARLADLAPAATPVPATVLAAPRP